MSTPQFHTDPLSSTQGPHLFSTQNLSVQHRKPLSLTPESLSSKPKIPQFNTLLSSTPKTPEFNTKNSSVQHQKASPKNSQKARKPENFQGYATNEEIVHPYNLFMF